MTNENLNQSEYDVQTTTDGTSVENTDGTNNTPLLDVDGSVKTNHIEDGAVTGEKLSSDVLTDSYIDITDTLSITEGYYDIVDGLYHTTVNSSTTGYISCQPGDKYRISGYTKYAVALVVYLDNQKNLIKTPIENGESMQTLYDGYNYDGELISNLEITIPENCCYVVFQSHALGELKVEKLFKQEVEKNHTISYWKRFDSNNFEISARWYIQDSVLHKKTDATDWQTLGKIPCKPGDKFIVTGFIVGGDHSPKTAVAMFVDKNNNKVAYFGEGKINEGVLLNYEEITAPENSAYVMFNSYHNGLLGTELYVRKYVTEPKSNTGIKEVINSLTNPLYGKKIFADGDSIAQGSDGISYADIIARCNNMKLTKTAVGGTTLAKNDSINTNPNNKINYYSICERVLAMDGEYDYILLEGGWNDMFHFSESESREEKKVEVGTLTNGYDMNFTDDDIVTTIAATEAMCQYLVTNYFDTPKLFVLGHKKAGKIETQNIYWDGIKSALEKWGIPYVDLRKETTLAAWNDNLKDDWFAHKFEIENGISVDKGGDGTHPNRLAYERFYVPLIEAKLKSL